MNGGQRNGTNAQIWGKKNDSNYDGNCTARHFRFGTYKISGRWIFVDTSVPTELEAGSGPEPAWLLWRRENFFAIAWNQTTISQLTNP